jgi:hypothetical protein
VGRLHVDPLLGFCVHPAAENAATWKRKNVHAVVVDDSDFKIAADWRGKYRLPIHKRTSGNPPLIKKYRAVASYQIDLDQSEEKVAELTERP